MTTYMYVCMYMAVHIELYVVQNTNFLYMYYIVIRVNIDKHSECFCMICFQDSLSLIHRKAIT